MAFRYNTARDLSCPGWRSIASAGRTAPGRVGRPQLRSPRLRSSAGWHPHWYFRHTSTRWHRRLSAGPRAPALGQRRWFVGPALVAAAVSALDELLLLRVPSL